MVRNSILCSIVLVIATVVVAGCGGREFNGPIGTANVIEQEKVNEYIVQYEDVLDIKFFYNKELNERVKVRPDGKISLQLIDEVEVVGLTPVELDQLLTEKYSAILKKPEVSVIVQEVAIKRIFVGGEVNRPGVVPWKWGTTPLMAVFTSGGFKESAYPASVVIISKGSDNRPVVRQVNLEVMSQDSSNPQNDVILRPFDIVYVPKSKIATANKFVKQYIKDMIPVNLNTGFTYSIVEDKDKN